MRKGAESAAVNPLLVNLDECLAFHLRELMGAGEEPGKPRKKKKKERDPDAPLVDVDPALTRVLDRLILYLRIVHSVDYYGARYIPDEDDQPRRIGLLTLRGEASRRASPKTLAAYCQHFEGRLAGLLPHEKRLAEEHIELLGKRSVEEEVDRFVDGNIVSVVDGMSRCGLCHKRFTTPDYAKMHLRERHKDKLEEVKWVVVTFNNYLADPTRPSDADFTAAAPPTTNTADTVSTAPKPKTSQKPAFININ